MLYQDGLTLRYPDGRHVQDAVPNRDIEDRGEVAIGYGSESFEARLGAKTWGPSPLPTNSTEQLAHVFSSARHGDPATPIIRAYQGDAVRLRVGQGGDRKRQHALHVAGHNWMHNPLDPGSRPVSVQGGITVGSAFTIRFRAGGTAFGVGDYLYGDVFGVENLSGGSWGILRVYPRSAATSTPTALATVDDPRSGTHPLVPLP